MVGLSRKPGETLPSFDDHPHQPSNFKFPLREFAKNGKKRSGYARLVKRAFQSMWFKRWNGLHYDKS